MIMIIFIIIIITATTVTTIITIIKIATMIIKLRMILTHNKMKCLQLALIQ